MSSGAIMPRARMVAQHETSDLSGLAQRIGVADPFDALVDRMRPVAARSVDALQVAAALEASGMTDRAARVEFGYVDVFDLAEEICRRVEPAPDRPRPPAPRDWSGELRDIGHGALYLLPAAAFPVAFGALGRETLILGVVLAAALGWIWSGATAWLAYRLLGDGRPGSAGVLLRRSSLQALPMAGAAGALVASATDAGPGLIVLAIAQMAYQMAATTLVFYHREGLVFAAMAPAVTAGICYLAAGRPVLPLAVAVCLASVALALGLGVWQTTGRGEGAEPALPEALRGRLGPFPAVIVFTTLSAAFFLYPQGRHLREGFDIAVAALPVIVGMGVVEWRARRFGSDARILLTRVHDPRQFVRRVWGQVLGGLGICLAAVSGLAVLLLFVIAWTGTLSTAGVIMAATGVLLAGAYYLGFLLANLGRFGWLCGSLLLCVSLYAAAGLVTSGNALRDTTALLGATMLLILLYLAALAGCVGEAHRHR
jgi:hypothetical protein